MPEFIPLAAEMLMSDEGFSSTPYYCTAGALTIGYGHNLDAKGISKNIAEAILVEDMLECLDDLETFSWWDDLNDPRKAAILNMRFQLGPSRFRKFRNTIRFLELKLYHHAALEMLDSRWAKQTTNRAHRISKIIDTGRFEGYV